MPEPFIRISGLSPFRKNQVCDHNDTIGIVPVLRILADCAYARKMIEGGCLGRNVIHEVKLHKGFSGRYTAQIYQVERTDD